jgi:hypothetical protein
MFDSDFITNPYRTYEQLRNTAPLLTRLACEP